MERIEPIRPDRSVQKVELTILTPVEREKQRRERERRRQAPQPQKPRSDGDSGIDVRV
jgi:hypothetical protein